MTMQKRNKPILVVLGVTLLLAVAPMVMATPCGNGKFFAVYPSGDGTGQTDFENISKAFKKAGSGNTVHLMAGTFYLHKSIVVLNFNGTLTGSGRTETTVQSAPGVTFDVSDNPDFAFSEFFNRFQFRGTGMFLFIHQFTKKERTVRVCDLRIVGNEPTTPWSRGVPGSPFFVTDLNSMDGVLTLNEELDNDFENPIDLNVFYERIDVEGVVDPNRFRSPGGSNFSVGNGLVALGNSKGDVVVEDVHVKTARNGLGLHDFAQQGSRVVVEGSVLENTVLGLFSDEADNWIVSNNEFRNSRFGILIESIKTINSSAHITNNKFNGTRLGIFGFAVVDAFVLDNTFIGNTFFGIGARNGDNWIIDGNNMLQLNPERYKIRLLNTNNSFVVNNIGVGPGQVLDNGENNLVSPAP